MSSLERLARNEALFREVNERIATLGATFEEPSADVAFVCECADVECRDKLTLTLSEYRHLREHSDCFAVKPGHEMQPPLERVVGQHCEYVVVQKLVEPD